MHFEYFKSTEESRASDREFEIQIASSGERVRIPADKTIVEALAEHGVEIPVSCEQGVCGTCLTRVISGVPDHRDMLLTEEEKAANDQITPCCSRALSECLVLDL